MSAFRGGGVKNFKQSIQNVTWTNTDILIGRDPERTDILYEQPLKYLRTMTIRKWSTRQRIELILKSYFILLNEKINANI